MENFQVLVVSAFATSDVIFTIVVIVSVLTVATYIFSYILIGVKGPYESKVSPRR